MVKPQYVDQLPKAVKGPDRAVKSLLEARNQMDNLEEIMDVLGTNALAGSLFKADQATELNQVQDRDIGQLSGGELQRFAIGIVCVQQADV